MSERNANSETNWVFASGLELESAETLTVLAKGAPRIGANWGPFEVLELLGKGATAQVFLVSLRGQRFALKILFDATERSVERLKREVALVGKLQHPGIVRLHGAGEVGGHPFVLYALVEGARSLSAAWAELDSAARLELVAQVASAVGYAHGCGVVHRDLKPDNVLVDRGGEPRVVDFGLATDDEAGDLTREGSWIGTPSYMAPEQFESTRETQVPAVDVWSLGVLLYEALTERLPFQGKTVLELATRVLKLDPLPPERSNPWVSPELSAVCLRALSKDPAERYPDARAFAQALRAAAYGAQIHGRTRRWPLPLGLVGAGGLTAFAAFSLTASTPAPTRSTRPAEADPFARVGVWSALADWGPEQTARRARERLEVAPGDVKARLALAAARAALEDAEESLRLVAGVLAEHPDHPVALDLAAHCAYELGDLQRAEDHCRRGLELDGSRPRLWVVLSLVALARGDPQAGGDAARRALDLRPDSPSALAALGTSLALSGDHEQAVVCFRKALEEDDAPLTHFNLGRSLLVLQRYPEAIREFEATLALDPEDQPAQCLRVRALAEHDPAAALAPARDLVARYPDNPQAQLALGVACLQAGRRELAREPLNRCVELDPDGEFGAVARKALERLR